MSLETHFAPAERADAQAVAEDHRRLNRAPFIAQLLNSFIEPAMILNEHRQVVFANDKLLETLRRQPDDIVGLRLGELFRCIHAWEQEAGCGTSRFCSQCGAARALMSSAANGPCTEECRIMCSPEPGKLSALDLRVCATPMVLDGRRVTVFAVRDITDEKRKAVLERLFFHDILNAAGGLKGLIEMWPDVTPEESGEVTCMASHLADQLVEEIRSYRDLVAAERGDLVCRLARFDVAPLLSRLHLLYRNHTAAHDKRFPAPRIAGSTAVYSDEVLLARVIGNLLKNAFEAAAEGTGVELVFDGTDRPTISVHNEGHMPKDVQLQIFQRSFSTKAAYGRGLGTYSVKLLTEQYLGGQVHFTSSRETGTTFTIVLPHNS